MRIIYIFESLHKLVKADQLLKCNGLVVMVIPVPSNYSSDCGMCLQIEINDTMLVDNFLNENCICFKKFSLN
jgi:Protein of unknown function (DUF3343)